MTELNQYLSRLIELGAALYQGGGIVESIDAALFSDPVMYRGSEYRLFVFVGDSDRDHAFLAANPRIVDADSALEFEYNGNKWSVSLSIGNPLHDAITERRAFVADLIQWRKEHIEETLNNLMYLLPEQMANLGKT